MIRKSATRFVSFANEKLCIIRDLEKVFELYRIILTAKTSMQLTRHLICQETADASHRQCESGYLSVSAFVLQKEMKIVIIMGIRDRNMI